MPHAAPRPALPSSAEQPRGASPLVRESRLEPTARVWGALEIRRDNGGMNNVSAIGLVRRSSAHLFLRPLHALVGEPVSAWEARGLTDLVPPDTLAEARAHRDDLARLLRREHEAAADFLLALADFDRRRGWEPLGHASLFAFLHRELGLSKGALYIPSASRR